MLKEAHPVLAKSQRLGVQILLLELLLFVLSSCTVWKF